MNTVIIACRTIEHELAAAMNRTGCDYPVLWLESGLHNWPHKLTARLQELLDQCGDYQRVLLAMSYCGNSVVGLQTRDFQLVIPKCDDCITLLLGSFARRQQISATYFLTQGWLDGERNIWKEYQYCIEKYGKRRGRRIFDEILGHYKNLALVDTGCYDMAAASARTHEIARTLGLQEVTLEGTLDYLTNLLSGGGDPRRFLTVPENATVTANMCTLNTL